MAPTGPNHENNQPQLAPGGEATPVGPPPVMTAASASDSPVALEVAEPAPTPAGPEWGLNVEGAFPKWGARAIFDSNGLRDRKNPSPIDIVFNRHGMAGGDHLACRAALGKWLDQVGLPLMNRAIAEHPDQEMFEVKAGGYILRAKNQGRGGYVYLGAATLGEATLDEVAAAKWSGLIPIPAIGERVEVRMNGFGPGIVVGQFVEAGYAGVKVLLDTIPTKKASGGYDWPAHMARNKSIEVVHAFGIEVAAPKIAPTDE